MLILRIWIFIAGLHAILVGIPQLWEREWYSLISAAFIPIGVALAVDAWDDLLIWWDIEIMHARTYAELVLAVIGGNPPGQRTLWEEPNW